MSADMEELHRQVMLLEQEVGSAERTLDDLQGRIRTVAIEADAARDPAQFRPALLARSGRPGALATVTGFFLGTFVGFWTLALLKMLVVG